MVFPVIRVFSTALRPGQNVLNPSLDIIPEGATLDAFYRVLFETNLPNWLFNSLMVTLGTATIGVTIAAASAYGFSRYKFRARGTGLTSLFATQLIPGVMLSCRCSSSSSASAWSIPPGARLGLRGHGRAILRPGS